MEITIKSYIGLSEGQGAGFSDSIGLVWWGETGEGGSTMRSSTMMSFTLRRSTMTSSTIFEELYYDEFHYDEFHFDNFHNNESSTDQINLVLPPG